MPSPVAEDCHSDATDHHLEIVVPGHKHYRRLRGEVMVRDRFLASEIVCESSVNPTGNAVELFTICVEVWWH